MAQNPDSILNMGQQMPQFSSRFADPNHAVNKGGPLEVLTGGNMKLTAHLAEKKEAKNMADGRYFQERTASAEGEAISPSVFMSVNF
jgi:hypothetical protein